MSSLLRIATAGSVDDGKSTLIGRLLHDTKSIFEDQLSAIEKTSLARGDEQTDLALLTDGLRAEREQGITIDVAHRYFATPRRKFVIADTPGHIQYTRNMVTGASTANLALLLVDARKGVLEQTRRHALLSSLLRVPHLILCVNKMDLVDYDEAIYDEIREEFTAFAAKLEITDLGFVPISALQGDNVVERSTNMPWFDGQPLLGQLEDVHIASDRNLLDNRLAVQTVIRPMSAEHPDYRGYAGSVVGGIFKQGDEVMVLPSRKISTISRIDTPNGAVAQAFPPMAVTMLLDDELDVSRGDMICRPSNQPTANRRFEATLCWFDETSSLRTGAPYQLKHTTRWITAEVEALRYRLDVDTLHRDLSVDTLEVNDIGRVSIHATSPLFFDEYRLNRTTGSFILVDPATDLTVAAGMIIGAGSEPAIAAHETVVAENITFHPSHLSREERWKALGTCGRDDLDDRPLRLGQVDDRDRGRAHAGQQRPLRLHARRRQPSPRPQRRPRLQRGGPGRERAPRRRGREAAGRVRHDRDRLPGQPLQGRPRPGPRRPRGGRDSLLRGLRRHAAGGVRTARPEGPLREGPRRRDQGPDRRRQPVRGADGSGADDRRRPRDRGAGDPRAAGVGPARGRSPRSF